MTSNTTQRIIQPHRQIAYDAVFDVIRRVPPRSTSDYGRAAENSRVWRAVEAALTAIEAAHLLPAQETTPQKKP